MQRPAPVAARPPIGARLALVLLVARAAAVEVQPASAARLRGAPAGSPRPESLAQVEQRTLVAQQQALEAVVVQEERLEEDQLHLERREEQLSERLDRLRYLEQASGLLSRAVQKVAGLDFKEELLAAGVYIAWVLLVTVLYGMAMGPEFPEMQATPDEQVLKGNEGFAWNLWYGFNCDPDWRICVLSCFALPVRWADTASRAKVQFVEFWPGLLLFTFCVACNRLTYGTTMLLLLIVVVQNRQKIRKEYGLAYGDVGTRMEDCCIWLLCPSCAAMQEAMEVEFVEPPRIKGIRRIKDGK